MRGHSSVGLLTIAMAMTLVGCGGGGGDGSSSGGSSGTGGSGGTGVTSSGGSDTTGSGGGGAGATGGGGAGGGGVDPSLFAGVDVSGVPLGSAPAGCVGQFDAAQSTLSLSLGQGVSTLLLGAVDGHIQANGVDCTAADGTHATVESVATINITGTPADETVILDLATGTLGDRLFGGQGGVHVSFGGGADTFALRGSLGDDRVVAGMVGEEVGFDPTDRGGADVRVAEAESFKLSLGPGKDTFRATGISGGGAVTASLAAFGDDGDDGLQGGAGDDALHGGAGDDTFLTAAAADGADLYDGGEGKDTLDYSARQAGLSITLGAGDDDGEPGEGDDAQGTIERLLSGDGDDTITGSPADDEIHGGGGHDLIHGGDGSDSLSGELGDDDLFGDDGDDKLDGGLGSDVLDGGDGKDVYDGGDGDGDVCFVDAVEEPAACELY